MSDFVTHRTVTGTEYCKLWAQFGEQYALNEFRACYDMGGRALVQRLCDKRHAWDNVNGVASLIPNGLAQGIMGYAYNCPDMIGGGEYSCFLDNPDLDEELIVRFAQCAALFPMMQSFPYRRGGFLVKSISPAVLRRRICTKSLAAKSYNLHATQRKRASRLRVIWNMFSGLRLRAHHRPVYARRRYFSCAGCNKENIPAESCFSCRKLAGRGLCCYGSVHKRSYPLRLIRCYGLKK